MTAKELISQYVDTGLKLPEYQVNKLSNQDKKTYIRKRLIATQSSDENLGWYEIELLNPDEKDNYISKLDSDSIGNLLYHSSDKDKVINVLLNNDTLISNLDSDGIDYLLDDSRDKDKVINVLLNNTTLISNLDFFRIKHLLQYSSEPKNVVNILGDKINGYLEVLGTTSISSLLKYSINPDEVINILLSNIELMPLFSSKTIRVLLDNSSNPKNVMDVLGDSDKWVEYISDLGSWDVYNLLYSSSEPEQIMLMLKASYDKLGMDSKNKVIEFISTLKSTGIDYLLNESKNPEAIKRIFDKYGIDYTMYESIKSLLRKNMIYL
jgi:hypothetical protein